MSKVIKITAATLLAGALLGGCYWFPGSYYPEYQNQYGNEPETSIHDKRDDTK